LFSTGWKRKARGGKILRDPPKDEKPIVETRIVEEAKEAKTAT
jgi:hypothetical protein